MTEQSIAGGFSYEPVDASEIPTRPRPVSPGRPSANPHTETLARMANTKESAAFRLPLTTPGDDKEVNRLVARHTRWLRQAAHDNDRGVRIWHKVMDGGNEVKIYFTDKNYTHRPRGSAVADPTLFEGNPDA